MLHIDGNHGEGEVVADVEAYLPKVRPGGWVWMDDTDNPTVATATGIVEQACELVKLYPRQGDIAEHRLYRVPVK
jgi:hypothetical protein